MKGDLVFRASKGRLTQGTYVVKIKNIVEGKTKPENIEYISMGFECNSGFINHRFYKKGKTETVLRKLFILTGIPLDNNENPFLPSSFNKLLEKEIKIIVIKSFFLDKKTNTTSNRFVIDRFLKIDDEKSIDENLFLDFALKTTEYFKFLIDQNIRVKEFIMNWHYQIYDFKIIQDYALDTMERIWQEQNFNNPPFEYDAEKDFEDQLTYESYGDDPEWGEMDFEDFRSINDSIQEMQNENENDYQQNNDGNKFLGDLNIKDVDRNFKLPFLNPEQLLEIKKINEVIENYEHYLRNYKYQLSEDERAKYIYSQKIDFYQFKQKQNFELREFIKSERLLNKKKLLTLISELIYHSVYFNKQKYLKNKIKEFNSTNPATQVSNTRETYLGKIESIFESIFSDENGGSFTSLLEDADTLFESLTLLNDLDLDKYLVYSNTQPTFFNDELDENNLFKIKQSNSKNKSLSQDDLPF